MGTFPLVVGSDIIFDGGQITRVLAATDMMLDVDGRCVIALSNSFEGFVATLCAQAEARGFTTERYMKMGSGTTIVVFRRGNPQWNLPVADPSETESSVVTREDDRPD